MSEEETVQVPKSELVKVLARLEHLEDSIRRGGRPAS